MRRLAALLLIVLSLSPNPGGVADDWLDEWSRSDLDYIDFMVDGDAVTVMGEGGETLKVRFRFLALPGKGRTSIPQLVVLPGDESY